MAINQAIENLKVTIEANSAQIRCEICPVIMWDEIQLTQLFQNLINNAIKFHKKEDFPCIHISVEQKDDQWLFAVQDNGIGIDREHIQSIFEIFRRLHPQSEYTGSGIGLSLCKRIVESHLGNIWAESEIGKGTTVYFTIPKIH
jgi:light-regulated signal transduction histidine kinase (bacteriophytochrome)